VSAGAKTEKQRENRKQRGTSPPPFTKQFSRPHSLVPYPAEPLWRRDVAVGVIGFCQSVGEGISQHGKEMLNAYLSTSKQSVSAVAFFTCNVVSGRVRFMKKIKPNSY